MKSVHEIISAVSRYAERLGIAPETVARKATGNPRLIERMERRSEQLAEDVVRLEKFMKDNPLPDGRRDKRHLPASGDGGTARQGSAS